MGSIIRLFLSRAWFNQPQTQPCPWALYAANGSLLQQGESPLNDLAPAKTAEVILAADLVLLVSSELPAKQLKKLGKKLVYAIEDQLVQEPEQQHAVAIEANTLAVVSKDIMHTVFRYFGKRYRLKWVGPETVLVPWQHDSWSIMRRSCGSFLRHAQYGGLSLSDAGDTLPIELKLALQAGEPRHIKLYGEAPADPAGWPPYEYQGNWEWQQALLPADANLLQHEFAASRLWQPNWQKLEPIAWLALVLMGINWSGAALQTWQLKQQEHALTDKIHRLFSQTFPGAVQVDPVLQTQRNWQQLKQLAGEATSADFLPLLYAIAPHLHHATVQRLDYQTGSLDLVLTTQKTEAVLQALRSSGLKVTLKNKQAQGSTTLLELHLQRPADAPE